MSENVEISGYGVSLKLNTPFQANRVGRDDTIVLAHQKAGALKNALIKPGAKVRAKGFKKTRNESVLIYQQGNDGTSIALGVGMKDLSEIGKGGKGPKDRNWLISTPKYRVGWPAGMKLISTDPNSAWPFELVNDESVMITLRGPLNGAKQVPAPPQLVGPGQNVVDEGSIGDSIWLELEYQHDGTVWRQRHYYGILGKETVLLISGQAPVAHAAKLATACESMLKSLTKR